MQVHSIKRAHPHKKKKLVARGGKRGKTSGRGGKGQTARAGNKRRPVFRDIMKKLPKLRGHGKNRAKSVFERGAAAAINVSDLNVFAKGEAVTPVTLSQKNIIRKVFGKIPRVKILGNGEISVALTVSGCDVSTPAKAKIEKAGGSVTVIETPVKEEKKKVTKKAAPKKK